METGVEECRGSLRNVDIVESRRNGLQPSTRHDDDDDDGESALVVAWPHTTL